jgi:chromate reductase, NAD(P)H dehydrogenase (quinone)
MNILIFSGSLRTDSYNKKLAQVAESILQGKHQTTYADLKDFKFPVYDGDIEAAGIPQGVKDFGKLVSDADALVISSPEYNGAMAGSLKNAIDWISRLRPIPLEGKPVLLMGASPGAFGAIRALTNSRIPFDTLTAYVYPTTFALPKAADAFASKTMLADENTHKKLISLLDGFSHFAQKFIKEK